MLPKVYQTVLPQDFTLTPCRVYKKFIVQRSQFYSGSLPQTGSGYKLLEARYPTGKLKLGTDSQNTYETNSFDGSYKSLIWSSIDAQFYRNPYDPYKTFEHSNERFTYKFLGVSASVISIPYLDYGESIKPGSVEITASSYNLNDDGNGNLYDPLIETGSFANRYNVVGYWGFNDEFRKFKVNNSNVIEKGLIPYKSRTFSPNQSSVGRNISIDAGIPINGIDSSHCAGFNSSSIITENRNEFNFASNESFTICFWVKISSQQTNSSTIISKNTMIQKQVFGSLDKVDDNGLMFKDQYVSSSLEYDLTNVYPFRFEYDITDNHIYFKRSDGINVMNIACSNPIPYDTWKHIAVTYDSTTKDIVTYTNGATINSESDTTLHPINKHSLVFGTDNIYDPKVNGFIGNLDEVRIYDVALSPEQVLSLCTDYDQSPYQTAVVGNVFYKSGNIVISGHDTKYNDAMVDDWTLKFRSTHMIYSYECLVRIPAGSFNLSQNPTTLVNPNSDLIIDEMTGSLAEGALFPYATAIGLYNEKRELVAVAKLSQPLQMRDDVDISISIKFDS